MAATDETNSIQQRVNDICNELYASGTKPSVRLVLSMLPDVKSTSTVHKYFANWKKELDANQQSLYNKLGFSSEFTQGFMKEISRFNIEGERYYKEQAFDANDQRDVALDELSAAEDRLYKQTAVLEQKESECTELQAELIKSHEKLKAELAKENESHSVIVAELRRQLTESQKDNKALATANETLRTDIAKSELKLEGNEKYVNEVKSQNNALVSENKDLQGKIAEDNKTLARQEATISGNDRLIKNLESTTSTAQKEALQANTERLSTHDSLEKSRLALDVSNSNLSSNRDRLTEANVSITELRKTIEEQSAVISKLTS